MKKWLIIILVAIICVGVVISLFLLRVGKQQVTPTVTVTRGTIVEKAQAIGYIKPIHSNKVTSSVDGIVATIDHDAGDYVEKGTPLLKITPTPQPTEYATVYEGLVSALANERAALTNLQRLQQAVKMGLYSKDYQDYISAKQNYATAKAARVLAEQKLALLDKGETKVGEKQVANVVESPISGYILSRNVDVGDPVISISSAQAATTLFTMANMKQMMFEGSVDELDASKIHLHMPAVVTVGSMPKQHINGELTKIALQSDQENAIIDPQQKVDPNLPFNVSFKIQITNLKLPKPVVLRSGYSATADIALHSVKNVLILPERVLHFADSKVYVLLPAADASKPPIKKFVKLGLSDGVNVEIKSGLTAGEKVVDAPDTAGLE